MVESLVTLSWVCIPIPTLKCKCSPYLSILSFTNMSGSHDKTKEMLKVKIVFCCMFLIKCSLFSSLNGHFQGIRGSKWVQHLTNFEFLF
jgi:hypothetical protein